MRWSFVLTLATIGLVGCNSTPKREMRPPVTEEFNLPPEKYNNPPEVPRDTPLIAPKTASPGMGPQGLPTPGFGPGNAQGGARR